MKLPKLRWPAIKWPKVKWPDLNVRDLHVYPGLAIATAGGLILSVAWTLVTLGLFLTLMGIFLPKGAR